jgi:signal transduction histidine kinase
VIEETVIEKLREKIVEVETGMLLRIQKDKDIHGIWAIEEERVTGVTEYSNAEKDIISFYRKNLKGKNAHTLIMLEGKPFFLVNTPRNGDEILLLSDATGIYGIQIEQILDSLITSSDLSYFAILNEENTPVLFSTLYDNFLPLRGRGHHTIKTPEGKIFQIEETVADNHVIAGFDMESLTRIMRTNNIFLLLTVLIFIILEGVLFSSYLRFERFKLTKEREIIRFKEVGALSTGFAHEFRNSLYTLSLLANDLDGENQTILLDETTRMKAIMDSLHLLSTRDIKKEKIVVSELVREAVALLENILKTNAVKIKMDIEPKLASHGNRSLLATAIANIIKNSIEANAKNIEISASGKGKEVRITCIDDGKGIDPETRGNIFDPFFSKKGQSGIGLYLTKRIVELHGGRVDVDGNGRTRFTIVLVA